MPVLQLELPDLSATETLGSLLAVGLAAGDVISLSGPLGAGKSALARAIIQEHPEHYSIYSEKYFKSNSINQPNRNRLLWRDIV